VIGFDFGNADKFRFGGAVPTGYDGKFNGTLTAADFNDDLEAEVDAARLAIDHCVIFTPNAGDLAGTTFLIVDVNNVAGYQASLDYVIELVSPVSINAAELTDFTG
jgi:hypothetical protein